ncbi:MAG: hypothetical protein AVDCRST_MAG71-3047 [uncultured Lysobacter sp.]|uniref:DUF3106 domain-containing protein n=1 Tax=uncultured Lysobacter sp. TaxID=271060 RepID=A0A6J4MCI7_9GAMM|nr:MAG: hypothetical protein AVDCRST_MAG71-3047 [uncultured Lysobacter sp.]
MAAPALPTPALLSDFARTLPLLQPRERSRLVQRAEVWAGWSRAQRRAQQAGLAAWDALPAAERGERRERYLAWQALPIDERRRIDAAREVFAAFAPGQQQELRARFAAVDLGTARGWRLGPALGADYAALQPLLAQVPVDEHEALLRVLRAMTPPQRQDLAVLVQRTPPQERGALRRELVSTAASSRDAWLYERLQR